MLGSKKKEEAFPVNEALLNVITPMGLEMSEPLSMGVIPTETMVLGMLVILESHPISTFCG